MVRMAQPSDQTMSMMVISGQSARRVEASRGRLRRWSWGWCARRRGSRPWWRPKAQLSTSARLLRDRGRGRGRRRHDVRRHTDDTCNSNQSFCCWLLSTLNLAMILTKLLDGCSIAYVRWRGKLWHEWNCESIDAIRIFNWMVIDES